MLLGVATLSLVALQAIAAPSVDSVTDTDLSSGTFCRFHNKSSSASVVVGLKHWEAKMRLDGELVQLQVEEAKCHRNCVAPGRTGVRVFNLSAPGITATLKKKSTCARDAEACSGLDEGNAELAVSTSTGTKVLPVWGEYCDM
jgi:hypothetical protein